MVCICSYNFDVKNHRGIHISCGTKIMWNFSFVCNVGEWIVLFGQFLKHPEIEDFAKKNDHIYSQSIQSPANWERVIEGIRRMRSAEHAPVDSIDTDEGMNSLQPQLLEGRDTDVDYYFCFTFSVRNLIRKEDLLNWLVHSYQAKPRIMLHMASVGSFSYMMLINNVSSESAEATQRLLKNGMLSAETMDKADEATIKSLIYPVGFYTRKARHLKQIAKICLYKYDGDISSTLDNLLLLPGVSPKIAHLVMIMAWNKVEGICVDTHVHRDSNWLGWVSQPGTKQNGREIGRTEGSLCKKLDSLMEHQSLPNQIFVSVHAPHELQGNQTNFCTLVNEDNSQLSVNDSLSLSEPNMPLFCDDNVQLEIVDILVDPPSVESIVASDSTLSYGSHDNQLICENGDVEQVGRLTKDDPLVVFVVDYPSIEGICDCISSSLRERKHVLHQCPWIPYPFDPIGHLRCDIDLF
ncbi:putative mannose/glucose-specific lectin-like [Capsicum annuum]|uniref:HhH-GPD domain-containing protein n=1 Tax=Capsicum annuum TaxID=4072 RepID=A0A2G2YTT3_CAPAN|nr:putative mannose/glucose-specific lectin-like [Capsicum annuum]KAF3650448.1 putative mannose/glucose-specific lectin-like [Capsicum annuum]PHT73170.1 hypothetical protein T459_23955 [Capsicum annuum]